MRKSDYSKVHRRGVAGLVILLLLFGVFAPAAMAGVWPRCHFDDPTACTAQDCTITDTWIVGNPGCTPGTLTNAKLWARFQVNRAQGVCCVVAVADIYEDGKLEEANKTAIVGDLFPGSTYYDREVANISWICGAEVTLKNIYVQWIEKGGQPCPTCTYDNCSDYNKPKCWKELGPHIVRAPLIANFTFDNVCFCTSTTFTNKTTGGNGSYTFDWDFGDGNSSTAQNPTHHYGKNGTYNVNLMVTDSNTTPNTDSQIYAVEVYQNPTANAGDNKSISAGGSVVIGGSPTASGGTPSYTYSWTPTTGLNNSIIANPTASPTSTTIYTVMVTDANLCNDSDSMTVYFSDIQVVKTANPTAGAPSTNVNFTIVVTNTGDCILDPVKVVDTLPAGMSYVSSSPTADTTGGTTIWDNVGPLAALTGSKTLYLVAHIDSDAIGILNNTVNGTGTPPAGDNVSDVGYAEVTTLKPAITVTKTASPTAGAPSTNVNFTIVITNTGDCILDPVKVVDTLPAGMSYVSSSPTADTTGGTTIWDNVGPLAALTGSKTLYLVAHIDSDAIGILNNTVNGTGTPPAGDNVSDDDIAQVFVLSVVSVELEKTGSPAIVAPGGNVTYTINYTNTGDVPLHDVVITEYYPKGVTFISADPAPDAGTNNVWTIKDPLLPGESGTIVIKVKVPEQIDLSFTETGSVIGEGLVMVTKDLSTEQKPYSLRNVVTLSCVTPSGKELAVSAYATTKVSGVPGTSLGITESGSGVYSSDEILDLETKNKTIILKKSTNAEYKPTSFNFSDSFSVDFTNKWKQDICSKNMEIDAAIHKKISDATYIDDETISRVDKDKSTMNFDSSFNGSLYVGARTKDTEISETYIGEFDVLQTIQIAKGPIPTPAPTPTPTPIWLPCPFNASPELNTTEDAEPTHDAKIKIEKSANRTSATVGDVIRYSYVVTNIGNINLTGVTVTDSNLGLVDLNRTELEPTEVANGTLLYTVNQSDVGANITNTADVTATDGFGDPVTNTSNQVIVTTDS